MRSLALALALAGCGDAPSCERAFHKVGDGLALSHREMAAAVQACEQGGYSGDTRRCVAKATSLDELEPCLEKEPSFSVVKSQEAELQMRKARLEADQAIADAKAAKDKIEKIESDLDDLTLKVTSATDALVAAQNDADRAAAKAKLAELQRQRAEIEAHVAAAKAAAERAQRRYGSASAPIVPTPP